MKRIPVFGAAVLAAGCCFAPLAFAQKADQDAAIAGAATQYNADAATSNFQASQLAAIPGSFSPKSNACAGGSEQALRHQIETLVAGQPDYGAMAPPVAAQWRSQIDKLGPSVTRQWGALVSLKGTPLHRGLFEARFEHVRLRWEIACQNSYGKITGISFKTLS